MISCSSFQTSPTENHRMYNSVMIQGQNTHDRYALILGSLTDEVVLDLNLSHLTLAFFVYFPRSGRKVFIIIQYSVMLLDVEISKFGPYPLYALDATGERRERGHSSRINVEYLNMHHHTIRPLLTDSYYSHGGLLVSLARAQLASLGSSSEVSFHIVFIRRPYFVVLQRFWKFTVTVFDEPIFAFLNIFTIWASIDIIWSCLGL